MGMRIFLDSASLVEVEEAASWGILSGVTTNPSLAAKEGRDFGSVLREICRLVDGPVSAEAVSLRRAEIVAEAQDLAGVADNVAVKIPVGTEGLAATKALSDQGIDVNMTLVFSVNQAMMAAAAGAAYVSPFIGRLDDIGTDGLGRLEEMVRAFGNYSLGTKIIGASIRHPMHVVKAALIGVDIVTVPFGVLKQMVSHPLTDAGVERFLADWAALQAATDVEVK
jgi:transaldolase